MKDFVTNSRDNCNRVAEEEILAALGLGRTGSATPTMRKSRRAPQTPPCATAPSDGVFYAALVVLAFAMPGIPREVASTNDAPPSTSSTGL